MTRTFGSNSLPGFAAILFAGFVVLLSDTVVAEDLSKKELSTEDFSQEYRWQEKRNDDGIAIYTKKVKGSKHKAVRAEMIISASLNSLVGLIMDTSSCHDLAKLCREATELEVTSETELLIYSYNDVPWPVSDRDAVSKVVWTQDPESLTISMMATVINYDLPVNNKVVRITSGNTSWQFEPLGNGEVRVTTEAHIDPGGPTPTWLTNMLIVDSPFDTMRNFRRIAASGKYERSEFEFITEP
ncbi:MAG: START domain-containing protein [Pseudomonadales bacterium]|jgi:hypothetical protein